MAENLHRASWGIVVTAWALGSASLNAAFAAGQDAPEPNRWEKDIQAFEKRDAENPTVEGGIVFAGSSSIGMWDLKRWFPGMNALNRGFGGSSFSDLVVFAHRIVLPHKPATVVLYSGDNDIAGGRSPEQVAADFKKVLGIIHKGLPDARVLVVAIKPSIARWGLVGKMRQANRLIEAIAKEDAQLTYIDVDTPMLGPDGKPRAELFLDDGLHLNAEGYRLWTSILMPYLKPAQEDTGDAKPDQAKTN
ncbi:MAG: hypothetical protein JXR94_13985 [Candidatus Hydrogenedentes bacterium]|nr:hypothetical protein [Candidatus Hydrogenedentota bacterium]